MVDGDAPTGSPALMRRINAERILAELRHGGQQSRAELARATGLSKPTVNALVEELVQAGYIATSDDRPTVNRPGRPAPLYAFRADLGYVVGADIGADKLVVLLADLDGTIVATRRVPVRTGAATSPSDLLTTLVQAVESACADASVDTHQVRRAVVGTPGVVLPDGTLTGVPQLPGLEGFALARELADLLPCPVTVDREVHLSLVAERWRGAAADLTTALYIQLGMGVGAGLLIDGRVFRGATGAAGEIGLMPVGRTETPPEGRFGAFEWATGGVGLAARGRAAAATDAGSALLDRAGGDLDEIDAALIFAAAAGGDPTATALVDDAVTTLADGIAALVCALNPESVILSGGLSRAGDTLLAPLRHRVSAQVPFAPTFVVSELSDEAVALGAVRLGLDHLERSLFHDLDLTRT